MEKTKKPNGPRYTKAVEFTDEFLKNLPVATHLWDFQYDKELPALAVRRTKAGGPVTFHLITNKDQRDSCLELLQMKVGAYVTIGEMPLAEARQKAKQLLDIYNGAALRRRLARAGLPTAKTDIKPEAILEEKPKVSEPNYDKLMDILMDAYSQAAMGKGAVRHANGLNFEDQDMLAIMDRVGDGFGLGQAIKKLCEGRRLDRASARREFLGAIVYIAGTILWMDRSDDTKASR